MKMNLSLICLIAYCSFFQAQVGINTGTPTEKLDVNGTLRVRVLPNDNTEKAIYTRGTNTSSSTLSETFIAARPLVVDTNGIMGTTTFGDLVPNNTTEPDFNTTNASSSMFVVRRFLLDDTVDTDADDPQDVILPPDPDDPDSVPEGIFSIKGYNTGMKVDDWQAIISNVSWKMTTSSTSPTSAQFVLGQPFNYRLQGASGGTWRIVGDIINVTEKGYIDILFIKSKYVAAEDRSN